MLTLRPFGIYLLPGDSRAVYALPVLDGYYLYDSEYAATLPPRYEVKPDGSIESWGGDKTRWRADDLADTGMTFVRECSHKSDDCCM